MTTYPNVPVAPGVPTVPRDPNNPPSQPTLLTGDSVTATGFSNLPLWGLIKDGQEVLKPDNWVQVEFRREWAIADYQIEAGSFESYDKVEMPFDIRVQMSCGGSTEKRADFLTAVEAIVGDLEQYDFVMPENTYSNVNVAHYDFRRTAQGGNGLLIINLYLMQIRATAAETFSSTNVSPASQTATKDPGAAAQVDDGAVQTQPLTSAQQNTVIQQGLGGFADAGAAGAL